MTGEKEGEGQGERDRIGVRGSPFPFFLPSFLPNVDNLRTKESKFSSLSEDDEKKGKERARARGQGSENAIFSYSAGLHCLQLELKD